MKISVVTPNYNYGRFLRKCLESVLAQLSPDSSLELEHIVQDALSTDETPDVLSAWRKELEGRGAVCDGEDASGSFTLRLPTLRYTLRVVREKDAGQTDAINRGLRRASGDLVCWLNADEYYLGGDTEGRKGDGKNTPRTPSPLGKIAGFFESHPEADFVYGEVLFVDKDDKPMRVKRGHPFSLFIATMYGCFISSCSSFWRRRILDDGHFLDPSYKVIMDNEYYCRLSSKGYRFKFIPLTVAAFTWHDENISTVLQKVRRAENVQIKKLYGKPWINAVAARRKKRPYRPFWKIARLLHGVLTTLRMMRFPRETAASFQ